MCLSGTMSIFSHNLVLHSISTHTSGSDARSDWFRALSDPWENILGRLGNALRALKPLYQVRRIVLASDAVRESISAQRGEAPFRICERCSRIKLQHNVG